MRVCLCVRVFNVHVFYRFFFSYMFLCIKQTANTWIDVNSGIENEQRDPLLEERLHHIQVVRWFGARIHCLHSSLEPLPSIRLIVVRTTASNQHK